jgi:hypothetical protein
VASTIKVNFIGDNKDLNRAIDETHGKLDRVGDIGKKTAIALGAGAIGAGYALYGMANAAAEDEKAQVALSKTIQNVTGATADQAANIEKWISKQGKLLGVTDDQLRPALDRLVRATGDVDAATELSTLAMDIAAGTGKDLVAVSEALGKAANGQLGPLKKLDPALAALVKEGASTNEVFGKLSQTFEGQAAAAADTTAGKLQIAKVQFQEMQEEIGAKVIPILAALATFITTKVIPAIESVTKWLEEHQAVAIAAAAVIGGVFVAALVAWTAAAVAAGAATLAAAAPVIAITVAIAALAAGVIYAYTHWGWFKTAVDAVAKFLAEVLWPIIQRVAAFLVDVFAAHIHVVTAAFEGMRSFINDKVVPTVKWFADTFNAVKDAVVGAIKTIMTWIDKLLGPLDEMLGKLGKVKDAAAAVGGAVAGGGDAINRANEKAQNKDLNGDGAIARSLGGPLSRGTYRVGEFGPEVLHMGAGSGRVSANAGGNITINVSALDSRSAAEAVVAALRDAGIYGVAA